MLHLLICVGVNQRIAEAAGVVVSFDPKPIDVSFFSLYLFIATFNVGLICSEACVYIMFFLFTVRAIGMALVLMQTTGR